MTWYAVKTDKGNKLVLDFGTINPDNNLSGLTTSVREDWTDLGIVILREATANEITQEIIGDLMKQSGWHVRPLLL